MKTIQTVLFVLIFSATQAQIPTDSLQIYFPFSGNMTDQSANKWQSTAYKTAQLTADRFGKANSACYISNGAYPGGAINALINPSVFHNKISVCYWVKIDPKYLDTAMDVINSKFYTETTFYPQSEYSEKITFDGKPSTQMNNIYSIIGKWVNVIVMCDGAYYWIYINGKKIVGNSSTIYSSNTLEAFTIGGSHFTGYIDDIRFYSKILTASEINSLVSDNVGIEQYQIIQNLSMYPNPATGALFVSDPCDIKIYSMTGQIVKSLLNSQQIDVSDLKGLYFVELRNKEGVKVEKVILY